MRILFYSNWYVKQTIPLANALARNHQVTAIFPRVNPGAPASDGCVEEDRLREILDQNVRLFTLPHMQGMDPLGLFTVVKARRLIRLTRPDIVHFNESYDFRCLLLIILCPGIKFVTTVHDPIPHSSEKISLHKFKHAVRDQIRRRSHGLIVLGESLRPVLSEYSGFPQERIHAVPHGEFRYYSFFDSSRAAVKDGHKDVLFFGRWDSYKGLDVLAAAEPLITARVPQARIILAGEGRMPLSELRPHIINPQNYEIRNYTIPDQEVAELFSRAEVVVLPYKQATQSGPLHIAGTFGKPAIVTRVGALPDVVHNGENGLLIPPNDPEALAAAVCYLLEHPDEAKRMGRNAKAMMAQAHSMEHVAEIQASVYRKVIENSSRRKRSLMMSALQKLVKKVKRDPFYILDESMHTTDLVAMIFKLGAGFLRGLVYRPLFKEKRGLIFINGGAKLRNCGHISLGRNFVAERGCEIQGLSRSGVVFGDNVTVGSYAMIRPSGYYGRDLGEGLEIGDRSNIGAYCYLGAYGGITIGREVMMGPRVSLFAENHNFERTDISMRQQGVTRRRIVIEDDCWLASGSVILAGVTIGKGSIIAAGAVVTKEVPPYSIVGGNPAKIIRSRQSSDLVMEEK
jgi:acetyltransferase-like isoleucine patch superfamily enzyme/glycosyltransferase involved in cell wall biosynthesis